MSSKKTINSPFAAPGLTEADEEALHRVPSWLHVKRLKRHLNAAEKAAELAAGTDDEVLQAIYRISEILLARGDTEIRKLFRSLDSRFYGFITVEQFRTFLDDPILDVLELSAADKDLIVSYCDSSDGADGTINYKEFFQTFYHYLVDAAKERKTTLRQVFIIARHGARFPLTPFPNNTAWPGAETFWKTYGGKLTPKGILQHIKLGKMFRDAYFEPLGIHEDDYKLPDKIHVYTSNTDRTFLSASSFLQGLCPLLPQAYAVENEPGAEIKHYQGIKIHIADTTRRSTPVVHGYHDNPSFNKLKSKCLSESPFFHKVSKDPEYLAFLDKMWTMTLHKNIHPDQDIVSRFKKFGPLASQMEIERVLKMPLYANVQGLSLSPADEIKAQLLSDVSKRTKFTGNSNEEHKALARAATGLLPATVCKYFELRIEKPVEYYKKSIVFFSAHDYSIMAFLSQMGFTDWDIPKFAAALILELHKIDGQYKVAIKYNPDPSTHKSVKDLRTYKLPLDKDRIVMAEAEEGMHSFEEFREYLMTTRQSFTTEEEWRANAGPSEGTAKQVD